MSDDKKGYFRIEEASKYCGIAVPTLRKYIKGQDDVPKLPALKPGRNILIKVSDLDAWLKRFPAA